MNDRRLLDIEEIKDIQLKIAKTVHVFCKKYEIQYCLSHGSLIGAVRHKGFIPWDDDIDLFMFRKDYNKFLELFPKYEKSYGLKMANEYTKPYYGRPITKVYDTRTLLMELRYKYDDTIGVNIDIWPIDKLPDRGTRIFRNYIRLLMWLYYGNIMKSGFSKSLKNRIMLIVGQLFDRVQLLKKIEKTITKFEERDVMYVSSMVDPYAVIMRKEWFDTMVLSRFEDTEFYIPVRYDEILTALYGDYMKLPPIEKRTPHHIIEAYLL